MKFNSLLLSVSKPRRALRWLSGLSAVGCILLLVCYLERSFILADVALMWVVNEPTNCADAIVILGGGLENRPLAAARLFHDGIAPRILYMDVRSSPARRSVPMVRESEQTLRIMLDNGVPETALTLIGTNVANTFDESRAIRSWLEKSSARSIIIPTDAFHTRRVRWIFRKEFRGVKAEIHVEALKSLHYETESWWKTEDGRSAFKNEILKSIYYWLKY
jgi:uncharacterized SAM-binding protein YcdF (DUF218 family)